jgi:cell division protein FtsW
VKRHLFFLLFTLIIIVSVSLLSPRQIRRLTLSLFFVSFTLLLLIPFIGVEVKGAYRWVRLFEFSLQPSEFIKPSLVVVCAWLFSENHIRPDFPGNIFAIILYFSVLGLLMAQPDLGMSFLITVTWFGQFFLAGLPLLWICVTIGIGVFGLTGAYFIFPHVSKRVDRFFEPTLGDRFGEGYQINQSLEAFMNGGIFGEGPGEGTVKKYLPDAHSDFIFAVAGEEFGLILCLVVIGLFAFIVFRGFLQMLYENNLFILLAVPGLVAQFGLQAIINIASTIHLIPTKGMTLPFISYGGSSMLATAIAMAIVLGLTRSCVGIVETK